MMEYDRKIFYYAAMAFLAAPIAVLLHELAHLLVYIMSGIPAQFVSFSSAVPVGASANFKSLQQLQMYYHTPKGPFVLALLAGPALTHLLGYGGWLAYRHWSRVYFWALAFGAELRVIPLLCWLPQIINGSICTVDEPTAALFLGLPVGVFFWPSLLAGVLCLCLLINELPKYSRIPVTIMGFVFGIIGIIVVEYVADTILFS